MDRDPYAVLGVAATATGQEIKQAFRRLARECHPDVAGADPASSARFRDVRAAYELLSDPVRRARHNRRHDRDRGANPFDRFWQGRSQGGSSGGSRRGRGLDDPANQVSIDDLMNFGTVTVERPPPPPAGEAPRRPRASEPRPSPDGGAPRDDGRPLGVDAVVDVPLGMAWRGGAISVTTPAGDVRLVIPARCQGGTRFRLAGKGGRNPAGERGDFLVRARIVLPRELDPETEALLDALAQRL